MEGEARNLLPQERQSLANTCSCEAARDGPESSSEVVQALAL